MDLRVATLAAFAALAGLLRPVVGQRDPSIPNLCNETAPDCCRMELGSECIIAGIRSEADGCTAACMIKFSQLSRECHDTYKDHWAWKTVAANCDKRGVVELQPSGRNASLQLPSRVAVNLARQNLLSIVAS